MKGPIIFDWDGEAMIPEARFRKICDKRFVIGQRYILEEIEERSTKSHDHLFAIIHEAWLNLREDIADEFPTELLLRAHCTIRAGWCTKTEIVCASAKDAIAAAAMFRDDPYVIAEVVGKVLTVWRAKSLKTRGPGALKKEQFQEIKEKILHELAQLTGSDPAQAQEAA